MKHKELSTIYSFSNESMLTDAENNIEMLQAKLEYYKQMKQQLEQQNNETIAKKR